MVKEVVSGVGADAKRTDKNISERVAKIQREAKIENAPGGTYSQATQLQNLASGASTETPRTIVGSTPAPRTIASSIRMSPLDQMSENPGLMMDPTPMNRRLLESFLQEGR